MVSKNPAGNSPPSLGASTFRTDASARDLGSAIRMDASGFRYQVQVNRFHPQRPGELAGLRGVAQVTRSVRI
jgi:hypothetical protein